MQAQSNNQLGRFPNSITILSKALKERKHKTDTLRWWLLIFCIVSFLAFPKIIFMGNSIFMDTVQKSGVLQKSIESIDSSDDKWSVLKIIGQITFALEESLWKIYCKKQRKKKIKIKKQSLENSILKKLRSYFLYDLFSFGIFCHRQAWIQQGKFIGFSCSKPHEFNKRNLLASLIQNHINILQDLFFLQYFNLNWKYFQIIGSCFGPAPQEKWFLLPGEEVEEGEKEQTILHLDLKFDLKLNEESWFWNMYIN